MGLMEDTAMPVAITFAGRAYSDSAVLAAAYAYELATGHRVDPPTA
jgi:amidase